MRRRRLSTQHGLETHHQGRSLVHQTLLVLHRLDVDKLTDRGTTEEGFGLLGCAEELLPHRIRRVDQVAVREVARVERHLDAGSSLAARKEACEVGAVGVRLHLVD